MPGGAWRVVTEDSAECEPWPINGCAGSAWLKGVGKLGLWRGPVDATWATEVCACE